MTSQPDDIKITMIDNPSKFVTFCQKVIPLAFDESMSYYECLCALKNYIEKTVVPAVNGNAEAVAQLAELFNQLNEYVTNYFDNLDVQEEINNKLDAMVEAGTLQEIISEYLNSTAIWGFESISDMKASTNLINGSYAKTYGSANVSDSNGCFYYIRNKTNDDVVDEINILQMDDPLLVAQLIESTDYLPNIEYKYVRYRGEADRRTDVWYAIIPSTFKPELFLANGVVDQVEDPAKNSMENKLTVSINAGVWWTPSDVGHTPYATRGVVVNNGQVLKANSDFDANRTILYMDQSGVLHSVAGTTTTADLMALNPVWAITAFWPVLEGGVDYTSSHDPTDFIPRSFIAQNGDGDILIGCTSGRDYRQGGFNANDIKNFIQDEVGFNATFIYNLDGGGSVSLNYKGQRVNDLIDYENREVANIIGFRSKFAKNKSVFESAYTSNRINIKNLQDRKINDQIGFVEITEAGEEVGVTFANNANNVMIDGSLVCLNLYFTTTSQAARFTGLFEGLPLCTFQNLYVQAFNSVNECYMMYLHNDELRVGGSVALPAGTYNINVTYPKKLSDS